MDKSLENMSDRFVGTPQDTLEMIDYFTGPARKENKERFKKVCCLVT